MVARASARLYFPSSHTARSAGGLAVYSENPGTIYPGLLSDPWSFVRTSSTLSLISNSLATGRERNRVTAQIGRGFMENADRTAPTTNPFGRHSEPSRPLPRTPEPFAVRAGFPGSGTPSTAVRKSAGFPAAHEAFPAPATQRQSVVSFVKKPAARHSPPARPMEPSARFLGKRYGDSGLEHPAGSPHP
jgi:hypothetical protein